MGLTGLNCSSWLLVWPALQWFTLKDVKSGKVHLILEWVPTVARPLRLDQVGLSLRPSPLPHPPHTHTSLLTHCYTKMLASLRRTVSPLQATQLQSLQSYKNKAVPAAALLFIHLERAHSLPVGPPLLLTFCASSQRVTWQSCFILNSWRRVGRNQKQELN